MQQSNGYIIIFSVVLTIVLGGMLAFTAQSLRPEQKRQEDIFKKKSILNSVMEIGPEDDVLELYGEKISSIVVNYNGQVVSEIDGQPIIAENVPVNKEYKKAPEDRLYPVFQNIGCQWSAGNLHPSYIRKRSLG